MRLLEATSGEIDFEGKDITRLKGAALKAVRREVQMIFQDPYSSLNPRKTIGSIIGEPFAIHGMLANRAERKQTVQKLMESVGLNPEHYNRYPHEFSGGQRQRMGGARAPRPHPHGGARRGAGVGAGRLDPGAGPEPSARLAATARPDGRVHR